MTNAEVLGTMASTDGLFVVASAPAGWYEVGDGTRRWFDGRQWTSHYAPPPRVDLESGLVRSRHPINHGFHAIMLIMTIGVWMPVWAIVVAYAAVRAAASSRRSIGS